jgi:DNA-binding response OmpR family regulator
MSALAVAKPRLSFERAEGLVIDPVAANRGTARSALTMLGFRHLAALASVEDAVTVLQQRVVDLLLVDVTLEPQRVCAFVHKVREGDAGRNAYLHIILMTWKLDGGIAELALNCGADDLMTRPFSVDFLGARLRTHVEMRKPFVITSDYVGPDRRRDRPQLSQVPLLEVPNLLLAKGQSPHWSDQQAKKAEQDIKTANDRVNAQRVERAAFQCAFLVRSLRDGLEAASSLDGDLAKLATAARVIERCALDRSDAGDISKLVGTLCEDVAKAKSGADAAASVARIGESATALLELANPGKAHDDLVKNVETVYANVKARGSKAQKIA